MQTEQPVGNNVDATPMKEALTQIEAERIDVPDYVPENFVGRYRVFVERYGKEKADQMAECYVSFAECYGRGIADYYFQDKIEIRKLAELFGIKLKKHYSFPMLENNLLCRFDFARLIDTEGSIRIIRHRHAEGNKIRYYLSPEIQLVNTSKELAEDMAS